jgi:hypothetical protein
MGTGSFPGAKSGRSVTLTPHSPLVPFVIKEESYTSTPMGRTACTELQCLYKGALCLYFYYLDKVHVSKSPNSSVSVVIGCSSLCLTFGTSFIFVTTYSTLQLRGPSNRLSNERRRLARRTVKPTTQSNAEAKNAFLYTLRQCFLI